MFGLILIIRKLADPTYYEKGYCRISFFKNWILRPKTISYLVTAPIILFFQNSI
jgi:hypothetical protein